MNQLPKATKLDAKPKDGYGGALFALDEPITLSDGTQTAFVITSFGLETILGDDNFAVFASDKHGRVIDWSGIYQDGEGPAWCADLAMM